MESPEAETDQTSDTPDDGLYQKRLQVLGRLKISMVFMLAVSLIWIAIGVVTIMQAAPDNHIPYRIGGGCIAGGFSVFYILIVVCMVSEGKRTPRGKNSTTGTFKCMSRCHFVLAGFLWTAILVGFGISGLWGTIECAMRTSKDDTADFSLNFCEPNKNTLYLLSVGSLILGAITMIILCLTHCFFCCNFSAFGMRHYQGYRGAYIDYSAGEESPPIPIQTTNIPASQPLYIRTEQGFQPVLPVATHTIIPSAPPNEQPRYDDRKPHDRYDHDDRRGRGDRGRGHRGRGRGPRDRHPDDRDYRDRDDRRPPRDRPPRDRDHDDTRSRDRPRDDRYHEDRGSPRPRDRPTRGRRPPRGGTGRGRNDRRSPERPRADDDNTDRGESGQNKEHTEDLPPSYAEVRERGTSNGGGWQNTRGDEFLKKIDLQSLQIQPIVDQTPVSAPLYMCISPRVTGSRCLTPSPRSSQPLFSRPRNTPAK